MRLFYMGNSLDGAATEFCGDRQTRQTVRIFGFLGYGDSQVTVVGFGSDDFHIAEMSL